MLRRTTSLLSLVLLLIPLNQLFAQAGNGGLNQSQKAPNIIFILADDLGYGDLTSYNSRSKVPTPHIDALSNGGIRFTRFYAGSTVCAPSRCALMTGKHMGHATIRGNANANLRAEDTTLAERLKAGGYTTGMFGKWGLGERNSTGEPQLKGFDHFLGYLNQRHAHHYFTDSLFEARQGVLKKLDIDSTKYTQDLIVNGAIAFINENKGKPFFLYLPVTIPHAELLAPDSLIRPFLNADGSSKFSPEKPFPGRASYRPQPTPHAAFAAMITKLDNDVGRVVSLVNELGLSGNTYIFFSSDNGPHAEGGGDPQYFGSSGSFRGIKRDLYEGGIRVPFIVKAPGKNQATQTVDHAFAFWDIVPTFCELAGITTPANVDGLSFLSVLQGKQPTKQHDYLYWQFCEGGVLKEAVMQGNWKLLRFKSKGKAEILELYNLQDDIGEKNNVASANVQRAYELRTLMRQAKTAPEDPRFDFSEFEK